MAVVDHEIDPIQVTVDQDLEILDQTVEVDSVEIAINLE